MAACYSGGYITLLKNATNVGNCIKFNNKNTDKIRMHGEIQNNRI